ncbi:hypothetical protein G7K_4690-t1 [Saitoella complicata NRRL Y-17804]|uniref:TRUD domain-containing protein n=1 Tax=Saitoella complicata (strain BCRC 22490 / CBS 7301 / JCM 7358 / NBRC 10748 / NRRL Y-17804) TaxID=698492 RepID=A0A0E9NLL1_SAICN|nr:hypothetical protein G7K_4690-t1 [Saitoella complicata NRRL Y-17804]
MSAEARLASPPNDRPAKRARIESTPAGELKPYCETDVGITEYINPSAPGFSAIIKQRYTDFLVNEIDLEGNVVHLTELRQKEDKKPETEATSGEKKEEVVVKEAPKEEEKPKPIEEEKKDFEITPEGRAEMAALIGEECLEKVIQLVNTNGASAASGPVLTRADLDKDERTNVHQTTRKVFPGMFETEMIETGAIKFTLLKKKQRNQRGGDRSKPRVNRQVEQKTWEELGGEFCHFYLYKENKDTMECASILAKLLKISNKSIGFAGTKDRRGCTVQRFSIHRIKHERLQNLNKSLYGFKIGNFSYSPHQLALGQLKGNEFTITLRNVKAENVEQINTAMQTLKEQGFINYFGMQRFGTSSIGTHDAGILLLQSNWEAAVELILAERKFMRAESVEARRVWKETKDPAKALKLMPRNCVAEYAVLQAMVNTGNTRNYSAAFQAVPRNLRLLYVHSYQSYVWNLVVSERIKNFGLKPVVGDLVLVEEEKVEGKTQDVVDEEAPELETSTMHNNDAPVVSTVPKVKILTQEDVDSGKYTIHDIVLPTPGTEIQYPKNDTKQAYVDIMAKDSLNPFDMYRSVRELSLTGNYRKIVYRPSTVSWEIVKYSDGDKQLVRTDLDLLMNTNVEAGERGQDGAFTAIVVKLALGTSQYATMALREVLKMDTSSNFQAAMTAKGEDKLPVE